MSGGSGDEIEEGLGEVFGGEGFEGVAVGVVGVLVGGDFGGGEEVVAEALAEARGVVVEVFLEEGEDFVGEGEVEGVALGGFVGEVCGFEEEVGVADLVVGVEEVGDAGVEFLEEGGEGDAGEGGGEVALEEGVIGEHLEEGKASAEGEVELGDGAVGGVEGAEDVEVGGYGEGLLGVGESDGEGVGLAEAFVVFDEGDEFAEDLGDVGAVDFVDDEEEFGGLGFVGGGFVGEAGVGGDLFEDAGLDVVLDRAVGFFGGEGFEAIAIPPRRRE
jgi:hypothetical protein